MARVDYYKFNVFLPYRFCGEKHRTLKDAKKSYSEHLAKGHHVGGCIYGMSNKSEDVFLTFTPWYSDTMSFGRTGTTYYGNAIKKGAYTLQ